MKGFVITTAVLSSIALAACAAEPGTSAPKAKIVATVNGENITAAQLESLWGNLNPDMKQNYESAGGKAAFLDYYIRKRLVMQEAVKQGFDKLPEIQLEMQAARDAVLFDRYVRDVVSREVVPDADVKNYYEAHKGEMTRPASVKVRHIVALPTKGGVSNSTGDDATSKDQALQKITRIAQQLRLGAHQFADIASKMSEDGAARQGGDLGWIEKGKTVPQFEEAAFALGKGQISHVVETPFGYHIILVEDKKAGGPIPFEEARRLVRERLLAERADRIMLRVNELTKELRGASKVNINSENL